MAKKACDEYSHQIISISPKDFGSKEEYEVKYAEKVKLLAISYHNLGIEQESMGQPDKAGLSFQKAFKLMEDKFGADNPFTKKFKRNYLAKIQQGHINDPNVARARSLKKLEDFDTGKKGLPE